MQEGMLTMGAPETTGGSRTKPDRGVGQGWVERHADVLFRYALQRVHRRDVAEELVQETFLAALRARRDFAGESSEQTWLVGILRHKIVDHIRRTARLRSARRELSGGSAAEDCFRPDGRWKEAPSDWGSDPVTILSRQDFWSVFEKCFARLPPPLADTFVLRELEERPPSEVCESLEITSSNLWVRLHRARLLLKECLEKNWFEVRSE